MVLDYFFQTSNTELDVEGFYTNVVKSIWMFVNLYWKTPLSIFFISFLTFFQFFLLFLVSEKVTGLWQGTRPSLVRTVPGIYLFIYLSIYLSIYHIFIYNSYTNTFIVEQELLQVFACLSIYKPVYQYVYLYIYLFTFLSIYLSIYL